jgi:hypothetical protein
MTPHNYEIVDCGAFCEVIFFCISPKNLLGDFFDSLGSTIHQPFGRDSRRDSTLPNQARTCYKGLKMAE